MARGAMRWMAMSVCVAGVLGAGVRASLGEGGVVSLGVLAGGTFSRGTALNSDGSVVTGSSGSAAGEQAFVWSTTDGMQSLGTLPGGVFSRGAAITVDGNVIVGTSGSSAGDSGFRWVRGVGMASMGMLAGGTRSSALGICPDGQFTVGSSTSSAGGVENDRAAEWSGGWFEIGALPGETVSVGAAINQFANAVAGWSGTSPRRAMRWVAGIGVQDLGRLPNGTDSFANAISLNGNVVAGGSSEALGMSGAGDVVVGTASVGGAARAFAWTRRLGMMDLNVYLASAAGGSRDLTGWVLREARAVSFDGTAIVGTGELNGQVRGFVVRGLAPINPPCRADFDGSGGLSANDIFSFLGAWFNGDARADFDQSGGLSVQDIFDFLNAWFAGC